MQYEHLFGLHSDSHWFGVRTVRNIGPLCSTGLKAQQAHTVRNYLAKRQIVQYFANIVLPPEGQLFGLIHSHGLQGTTQKQRCR